MSNTLIQLSWPLERLADGIQELAKRAGLNLDMLENQRLPEPLAQRDLDDLGRWVEWAGMRLGVEAESVSTTVPNFEDLLAAIGPAIIKLDTPEQPVFLLLLKAKTGKLRLLGQDLRVHRCDLETVRAALCAPFEAPLLGEIKHLVNLAEVPARRQAKVQALMLRERLSTQTIEGIWILRPPPTSGFWQQLLHERMPLRVMMILAIFLVMYVLEISGWALIGQGAINGRLDFGWLVAWALLVLLNIPIQLLSGWLDAAFALDIGRVMKKRLLAGAMRLDLQIVKHQGVGQLLSRVMESQALESLALNSGFKVVSATIEMVLAGFVLMQGAGGLLHLGLFMVWVLLTVFLCLRYLRKMHNWTMKRLEMTHALIERMVGHRTRLAQEPAERRDMQEDQMLLDYFNCEKDMDKGIIPIMGWLSRGWLIAGLVGMSPAFIVGTTNPAGLAVSLGGIMLAKRALSEIASGLSSLTRAVISWTQVSALFNAARKLPTKEPFLTTAQINGTRINEDVSSKLIDASDVVFRYRAGGEPVLRGANISIYSGERILFEGPSGGGKSTLASLLVGLRNPESGLILLHGLDRHTLGDTWHSLATEAPQFHENHIFSGTLAFNLLMGANWPASADEINEARQICNELGLEDLLARMPAGIMQMVGETGWQLSHGERSRIFLARALLQKAQLTILDESFAALDPESLAKCLACAFNRTDTLLVIAHP